MYENSSVDCWTGNLVILAAGGIYFWKSRQNFMKVEAFLYETAGFSSQRHCQ